MRDTQLYARILGIESPWQVMDVRLALDEGEVEVVVAHGGGGKLPCPECEAPAGGYDSRERRWQHLDTCQYRTILVAQVPRVECPEHGVKSIRVPRAEPGSPFTALYEALIIDWLRAANTQAVARLMGLTWDQVDGVMRRAVRRGLARRELAMEMWESRSREEAWAIFKAWYSWAIRSRLPPSETFPHCDLLPSRWSRPLPRVSYPHGFLMSHYGYSLLFGLRPAGTRDREAMSMGEDVLRRIATHGTRVRGLVRYA